MLILKNLNTLILGLCLSLLSLQTAAERLNENLVETKIKVNSERLEVGNGWYIRLNNQPPEFEFLLTAEKELFVRALYRESERFLKYGQAQLDRSRPVRVNTNVEGLIEHEGIPYAIISAPKNHQKDEKRFTILRLIPYVKDSQDALHPKFGRDAVETAAVVGFYGAMAVGSLLMVKEEPMFAVTGMMGLAGASIVAICGRPSNLKESAESQISAKCAQEVMVNRDDQLHPGNDVSVEKIDENQAWSANNIRVKPRRGKAHLFTTMLKKAGCEKSLMSFSRI